MTKNVQIILIILSIVAISHFVGWFLGVSLIAMIYFHEIGHLLTAKYFGAKTHGIYMLPMLGGLALYSGNLSRFETAIVALGGPVFGLLFSVVLWACGLAIPAYGAMFFNAATYSAIINLFNLLPINPLDGGQVAKCIAYSISRNVGKIVSISGIVLSVALGIYYGIFVLFFVAYLAYVDYKRERGGYRALKMSKTEMIFAGIGHFVLFFVLFMFAGYSGSLY